MAAITIPTRTDGYPAYRLQVELEGKLYTMAFQWNTRDLAWYLTISDSDGDDIVSGVRVVVDWDLLRRVVDGRRPPGELVAVDTSGDGEPGLNDLGGRVVLTYTEST